MMDDDEENFLDDRWSIDVKNDGYIIKNNMMDDDEMNNNGEWMLDDDHTSSASLYFIIYFLFITVLDRTFPSLIGRCG